MHQCITGIRGYTIAVSNVTLENKIGESGAGWVEGLVGTRFNSSTPEGAATKI